MKSEKFIQDSIQDSSLVFDDWPDESCAVCVQRKTIPPEPNPFVESVKQGPPTLKQQVGSCIADDGPQLGSVRRQNKAKVRFFGSFLCSFFVSSDTWFFLRNKSPL